MDLKPVVEELARETGYPAIHYYDREGTRLWRIYSSRGLTDIDAIIYMKQASVWKQHKVGLGSDVIRESPWMKKILSGQIELDLQSP